jgi:hypothetical protein
MRNQNLVGLKLPELSEAAEQEKGRWTGTVCTGHYLQMSEGGSWCFLPRQSTPQAFLLPPASPEPC